MRIPGEILKKYVKFGSPAVNGQYVCWVKPEQTPKMSAIPISPIKIKEYLNGEWNIPEQVIAWLGPLPVYSIDELFNEGDEADLIGYAIGTKEGMKKDRYKQGPFNESIQTQFTYGEPGDYVFELHPNKLPKIIKMWSENDGKWVKFNGSIETDTKPKMKFKRLKKGRKKESGKDSFWWIKGTKKQAAQGFKGIKKDELPLDHLKTKTKSGKKGEIIWNCSTYWGIPFPEFIWNGKDWKKPTLEQIDKIQNIVKRLMVKYEKTEKADSVRTKGL
jgi:hypothetical protein